MSGWLRALLGLAALAALAGVGAVTLLSDGDDPGDAVPTYRVTRAAFRREVPAEGNLAAVEATPILAPSDARMPLKDRLDGARRHLGRR